MMYKGYVVTNIKTKISISDTTQSTSALTPNMTP